jgi:4-amino-4-deoxy-L-arabinose transferase-like glycosyltransferase
MVEAGRFEMLGSGPEIFRTPGYPAFLTIVTAAAGSGWPQMGLWLAMGLQVLIDVHLVLLTFLLGRALASQRAGLVAAAFQAISPLAVAASCRVLSDSLFAFLLMGSLLLMVRHFRTGSWRALLGAAVVLGAACYVRPVGLAFSGLFAAVLLCRAKRLRRAAGFAAVVAACVAPWVARNAAVADYAGFSSFAGDSLYYFSAAEVIARQEQIPSQAARDRLRRMGEPTVRSVPPQTPGRWARYRRRRAMEILGEHPWMYMGIHLKGCVAFWLPGATEVLEIAGCTAGGKGTLEVLHREGPLAAARHYFGGDTAAMWLAAGMVLILLVRYAAVALCGLWRLRLRMPAAAWLCILLVAASFLLPGPAAHPRFRVPVEPILSVAAAIGWIGLIGRFHGRKRDRESTS